MKDSSKDVSVFVFVLSNFAKETVPNRWCSIGKRSLTKPVCAPGKGRKWKYQNNLSTAGSFVRKLSGVWSSRHERSSWGSCITEKRVCTVFVNQWVDRTKMKRFIYMANSQDKVSSTVLNFL